MRKAIISVELDDTGYSYRSKSKDLIGQQAEMCISDYLSAAAWVEPNTYQREWKFIKDNLPNWIELEFVK